jgi:hypothetical protein
VGVLTEGGVGVEAMRMGVGVPSGTGVAVEDGVGGTAQATRNRMVATALTGIRDFMGSPLD